jgi:POT family proton-dependent oligopeptide transporter
MSASSESALTKEPALSFSERLSEIKTGFERPFWVANFTELFERLSYYAVFTSLARYLHENLQMSAEKAGTLTSWFGAWVWIFAIIGGTIADRLGFRRALSLAYFILSCAYFLLGSLRSPWLVPAEHAMSLTVVVTIILTLPALGIAMVKPAVVGTTARASKENVRSIGYSIYYTLVNIGSFFGPVTASWVGRHLNVESVYRIAALSVFLMIIAIAIFFRDPKRAEGERPPTLKQVLRNFLTVVSNPRFMVFLLIFSGYWIAYWQEFIILPIYIHDYVDAKSDTAIMLSAGPATVILFTVLMSLATKGVSAIRAVILGAFISGAAWLLLVLHPSVTMAYVVLVVVAIGEIIQSPRYYEYVSRLAPADQQGTYMGFAFLPIGIGSLFGGPIGGKLVHHFGEVKHQPQFIWWTVAGVGVLTAVLLLVYDRVFMRPGKAVESVKA